MDPFLVAAVSGVTGGGLIGAMTSYWTAKRKTPAEVNNLIIAGAEMAVVALEKTLRAVTQRAERAEAEVSLLRDEVRELRRTH